MRKKNKTELAALTPARRILIQFTVDCCVSMYMYLFVACGFLQH